MIRRLYATLWHLAPFLIRRHLRRRALKSPAYLEHWDERFGQAYPNPVQHPIWIHAVSVGETRAAEPLVQALRRHFPDSPFLITQMTPTGRATAQSLFPDAQCRYLPYDKSEWVARFLAEHRPICGILMETEIWPNLMHGCQKAGIPLFLANARLSEKSQRGYLKIRKLVEPAMQTLSGCFAQTAADAERLHLIGASNVHVCGNTKYDIAPPDDSRPLAVAFKERIGARAVVSAPARACTKAQTKPSCSSKHGRAIAAMPCWSSSRATLKTFRRPTIPPNRLVILCKNAATDNPFPPIHRFG